MIALETERSSRESAEARYQQQVAGWEVCRPTSGLPEHTRALSIVTSWFLCLTTLFVTRARRRIISYFGPTTRPQPGLHPPCTRRSSPNVRQRSTGSGTRC